MLREIGVATVGLGVLAGGFASAAPVHADDSAFHVLSSQDLCNLVWPGSQAMPDPAKPVGTICARQGGVLSRLSNMMPTIFVDTRVLEPGKAPQLPMGSQRINPNDPLSDWVIPDCYVPDRVDCR